MTLAVTPTTLASGAVKTSYSPTANITPSTPTNNVLASTLLGNLQRASSMPAKAQATTNTAPSATTASSTPSSTDSAAASYYGNVVAQLKTLLGSLPTQQTQGVDSIQNSANNSINEANTGESQALSSIATQRAAANTNKEASLDSIDQNVGDTVASFQRLLAGGHAGDSAFAKDFVPLATAREGSTQAQGVYNSFGQDMGNLDTAQNSAQTQYGQNVSDIKSKENSDIESFLSGLADQQDQLNQQAAQAAYYQQEANGGNGASTAAAIAPFNTTTAARIAALNSLFTQYANPTYAVNPVTVSVPDISNYTQNPLTATLSASNPDTSLAYLPYLPQITKKQTTTSGTTS